MATQGNENDKVIWLVQLSCIFDVPVVCYRISLERKGLKEWLATPETPRDLHESVTITS